MTQSHLIRKKTREHFQDGRHFVIDYEFSFNDDPKVYSIKTTLKEKSEDNSAYKSASYVEISNVNCQLIEHVFSCIENAADPVFPVHIPDIIKDLTAQAILDNMISKYSTTP